MSTKPTKVCSKCSEIKSLSAFSPNEWHSDGLKSECKTCHNQQKRERRANDPEWARRDAMRAHKRERNRAWLRRALVLAIASDGKMRCVECGCSDVAQLEIDHIHEDGEIHRKSCGWKDRKKGARGNCVKRNRYYKSMLESACDDLQVLCRSCNIAKSIRHRAKRL